MNARYLIVGRVLLVAHFYLHAISGALLVLHAFSSYADGAVQATQFRLVLYGMYALFTSIAVLISAYHLALVDRKLIRPQAIDEAHMVKFDGLSSSPLPEIMDLFTESIVVLSPELRILHGNTASSMFFGEYFQGVSILQHIHPDSRDKLMEAARSLEAPAKVDTQQETLRTLLSVQYQIKSNPDSPESPDYFWVESRLCRRPPSAAMLNNNGVTLNHSPSCPYELLMVTCRRVPADMVVSPAVHTTNSAATAPVVSAMPNDEQSATLPNKDMLRYITHTAHDLKTPLQSFVIALDLLRHMVLCENEQQALLEQMKVSVDLMQLVVSQAIDVNRALSGAPPLPRLSSCNLSSILHRVDCIINGYGKRVPISYHVSPAICDYIITDEEWLWQMLLNYLTNACKFTDLGSINVYVSLAADTDADTDTDNDADAEVKREGRMLLFQVYDTGVGISSENFDKLFFPFAQPDLLEGQQANHHHQNQHQQNDGQAHPYKGQATGTGLGLYGVRVRAEGLGGQCGAHQNSRSRTGSGAVFWLQVPYVCDALRMCRSISKSNSVTSNLYGADNPALLVGEEGDGQSGEGRNGAGLVGSAAAEADEAIPAVAAAAGAGDAVSPLTALAGLQARMQSCSPSCEDVNRSRRSSSSDTVVVPLLSSDIGPMSVHTCSTKSLLSSTPAAAAVSNTIPVPLAPIPVPLAPIPVPLAPTPVPLAPIPVPLAPIPSPGPGPHSIPRHEAVVSSDDDDNGDHDGCGVSKATAHDTPAGVGALLSPHLCPSRLSVLLQPANSKAASDLAAGLEAVGPALSCEGGRSRSVSSTVAPSTRRACYNSAQPSSPIVKTPSPRYYQEYNLTAVVVDDTVVVLKLMEKLLRRVGFQSVQCYENGSRGLEALKQQQVDIVFSDVQMPIMTGPEMVQRFRAFEAEELHAGRRFTKQLIISVTANADRGTLTDGGYHEEDGDGGGDWACFDKVVDKPLSLAKLCTILDEYLATTGRLLPLIESAGCAGHAECDGPQTAVAPTAAAVSSKEGDEGGKSLQDYEVTSTALDLKQQPPGCSDRDETGESGEKDERGDASKAEASKRDAITPAQRWSLPAFEIALKGDDHGGLSDVRAPLLHKKNV